MPWLERGAGKSAVTIAERFQSFAGRRRRRTTDTNHLCGWSFSANCFAAANFALRNKVIRVRIFDGELGFGLAFQIAPLVAYVEHDGVSLGHNAGAHI